MYRWSAPLGFNVQCPTFVIRRRASRIQDPGSQASHVEGGELRELEIFKLESLGHIWEGSNQIEESHDIDSGALIMFR